MTQELAESVKRIRSTPNDRLDMMQTINALVELVGEMSEDANDLVDACGEASVYPRCVEVLQDTLTKAKLIAALAKEKE